MYFLKSSEYCHENYAVNGKASNLTIHTAERVLPNIFYINGTGLHNTN